MLVAVPQACLKISVKVALPEYELEDAANQSSGRGASPQTLTKSYTANVLATFSEDFKSGAKTFTLSDFQSSYSEDEWSALKERLRMLGINQVRVFVAAAFSPEIEQHSGNTSQNETLPLSVIE